MMPFVMRGENPKEFVPRDLLLTMTEIVHPIVVIQPSETFLWSFNLSLACGLFWTVFVEVSSPECGDIAFLIDNFFCQEPAECEPCCPNMNLDFDHDPCGEVTVCVDDCGADTYTFIHPITGEEIISAENCYTFFGLPPGWTAFTATASSFGCEPTTVTQACEVINDCECDLGLNPDFEPTIAVANNCNLRLGYFNLYNFCNDDSCCPEGVESVEFNRIVYVNGVEFYSSSRVVTNSDFNPTIPECRLTGSLTTYQFPVCGFNVGDVITFQFDVNTFVTECNFSSNPIGTYMSDPFVITQDIWSQCCVVIRSNDQGQQTQNASYTDPETGDEYLYGTEDNNSTVRSTIAVQPNPFSQNFQINLTTEKAEAYQLNIYDVQGKAILNLSGTLEKGENHSDSKFGK